MLGVPFRGRAQTLTQGVPGTVIEVRTVAELAAAILKANTLAAQIATADREAYRGPAISVLKDLKSPTWLDLSVTGPLVISGPAVVENISYTIAKRQEFKAPAYFRDLFLVTSVASDHVFDVDMNQEGNQLVMDTCTFALDTGGSHVNATIYAANPSSAGREGSVVSLVNCQAITDNINFAVLGAKASAVIGNAGFKTLALGADTNVQSGYNVVMGNMPSPLGGDTAWTLSIVVLSTAGQGSKLGCNISASRTIGASDVDLDP